MPKQILPILKAHSCRPQPTPEGVLQIVNTHLAEPRAATCTKPTGREHPPDRSPLVREDEVGIDTAPRINDRMRYPIEDDETFLAVLHSCTWNDEDLGPQLRDNSGRARILP